MNKLFIIFTALLLHACNSCPGDQITGTIRENDIEGSFSLLPDSASATSMRLNVYLEKSKLDRSRQEEITAALQMQQYWHVLLNGHEIAPHFSFPELSNTMSPTFNLVMPVEIDSAYWLADDNRLSISFQSPIMNFRANADENSLTCYTKHQHSNKQ